LTLRVAWIGLFGALVCLTFYAYSVPGGYFEPTLVALWGWVLVGASWFVSVATRLLRRRGLRPGDAVVPVLVLVVGTLLVVDAPLQARYRLSRSAMNATAKRVIAHPERARTIHRIGLWRAGRVEKIPGGMRFTVSGARFVDDHGFAYSPHGKPAKVGAEDVYTHLDGPWYLWDESW
jgi:hypothetical protein